MRHKLIVERDVIVPMRDGIGLSADVFRMETALPQPVLLARTPYGKGSFYPTFALMAAERGYVVVIQDTRGRFESPGDEYPFVPEREDGFDSVEWAAHQPWANGRVGMFGASYDGYTQWAAAGSQPPALQAIIPAFTFSDPYRVAYTSGALTLGGSITWAMNTYALTGLKRKIANPQEQEALFAQWVGLMNGMVGGSTFRVLPLSDLPLIGQNGPTPYFYDALEHQTHDAFWDAITVKPKTIHIPTFLIGGWYDPFLRSTLNDFQGLEDSLSGQQHQLLVGPWTHARMEAVAGEVDFGVQAGSILVAPWDTQLTWFDRWLQGKTPKVPIEAPIRLFVMGENRWRDESTWPLSRAKNERYYLHSQGSANSLEGDGVLSIEPPGEEPVDQFIYDPNNPVPTRGGGLCCSDAALPPGSFDQREIEARPDVLVYTSPVLETDIEVTGPLLVELYAITNAPDTDFTAKLVDVGPCGFARNLADGIIRARYRKSEINPSLIHPGEIYYLSIDMGATSNRFKTGHRIRLEISSSNFPRFDRNPNTGEFSGKSNKLNTAHQTVLHDSQHPSAVILPIIPIR